MAAINIALECFGMAVSFLLLLCCLMEKPKAGKQTLLFAALIVVNIAVLLCDALTWLWSGRAELTALLYLLNVLVYGLGYVLTALFTAYLVCLIGFSGPTARKINLTVSLLCAAAIGLVVLSLFNHMYFSFVAAQYVRGPLYWLSQVYSIVILLADMFIIIAKRQTLGRSDTISLLSYGLLPVLAMLIQIKFYGITLLYIATTLSLLVIYINIHVANSRRLMQRENELTQANISVMLSQIQPHFLYNSLAVIMELCKTAPDEACAALAEFSAYLRANMNSLKIKTCVPFTKELEHVQTYLALEKKRFAEELNVVWDIKETQFELPALTVQPVVENAVKYGVTQRPEGGTVQIAAWADDDNYIIEVADDGVGFDVYQTKDDGRTHIGIDNVSNRLKTMCGGNLVVHSVPNVGTRVTIYIPRQ